MSGFSAIDLTKLSAPDIIESLQFERILEEMIEDLRARLPQFSALVESDPVIKLLEVVAYRETLLRARINDASKAVMLAYATGSDLDHLAAFFGVERQQVSPGDPSAIPPITPTWESNDRLRKRTQLSLEGHSTAGPVGSYLFHALSASAEVKDVSVTSPEPGQVLVTVLSTGETGVPDDALITTVAQRLNSKDVRPLTDWVTVQKAEVLPYAIDAELVLLHGPDSEVVQQTALQELTAYTHQRHLLGNDIVLSGLYAALHQEGVQRVVLHAPTEDIVVSPNVAPWSQSIRVTVRDRIDE